MSDNTGTVRRWMAAAGITAVALIAPSVAVAGGPTAVLAKGNPPQTPADTEGAPCPGAYYCLAPGTDPQVPYGTDPFVPYGPDPVTQGSQAF